MTHVCLIDGGKDRDQRPSHELMFRVPWNGREEVHLCDIYKSYCCVQSNASDGWVRVTKVSSRHGHKGRQGIGLKAQGRGELSAALLMKQVLCLWNFPDYDDQSSAGCFEIASSWYLLACSALKTIKVIFHFIGNMLY